MVGVDTQDYAHVHMEVDKVPVDACWVEDIRSSTAAGWVALHWKVSARCFLSCTLRIRIRLEDSCYLAFISHNRLQEARVEKGRNLHSGCISSHFFFRLLQVMQPVLVRLLKTLFLRFRSISICAADRLEPYSP